MTSCNNNRKVNAITYVPSRKDSYQIVGSDSPVHQQKEATMRNALYQIVLLIAALGISGSMFSATLA